ncbi:hypothetical protein [Thermaerobacter subterraneus]|uniref:Uncharacterized protein n=1 Tax=Thermaerobacter subterraneus DSM 13965 TaxID=867903 RepID=K6Q287_9FIRM|nr:hypothetical protein [Thermaerobacter subterraneus]EKP95099.1 hypothetical protein ThesuDRAFT_00828 [Thermaerobacter subterraneus DSM 13965]
MAGRVGWRALRAVLAGAVLLTVSLLVAGCTPGPLEVGTGASTPARTAAPAGGAPTGGAGEAGSSQPGLLMPLPDAWYSAGGLSLRVDGISLDGGRVLVDVTVKNTADGQRLLLLGGCGPSQGAVLTPSRRYELYYRTSNGDDLTRGIPPGATRQARVVLAFRTGLEPDLAQVSGLEFHPGYVLDPQAGKLSYLEVRIPAAH